MKVKEIKYPNAKPVKVHIHDATEHVQRIWNGGRFYETHGGGLLNWVKNNVPWNGIYMDVGANIGNHTLFMIGVMNAKKVISVEPISEVLTQLERNLSLNGWDKKVDVYTYAVGAKRGKIKMSLKDKGTNNHGMWQRSLVGDDYKVEKIDTIVNRAKPEKLHYIKIDVEHMEIEAVQGAIKTLKKYKPIVSVECENPKNLAKLDAVFQDADYFRVTGLKLNHTPTFIYKPK